MARQEPFWDAYVHYAAEQARATLLAGARLYEPVFIRLAPATWQACRADLTAWCAALSTGAGSERPASLDFLRGVLLDAGDVAVGLRTAERTGDLPEFFVYRQLGAVSDVAAFEVIDIGPPVQVQAFLDGANAPVAAAPVTTGPGVVGAVIDTGLGFLHERFRTADYHTRFAAVWLQSNSRIADLATGTLVNEVLTAGMIDQLILRSNQSETEVYGDLNARLFSNPRYRRPWPRATHGTAVADIAFGAEGTERAADVPLLGVQIPPEAAQDTSGTISEAFIVEGVRWLCAQARQQFPERALVINISMGVLAGQKDGGRFIEEQIRREIVNAEAFGQVVHAVFAYGNGYNARQVAKITCGSTPEALEWVIQPDNQSASFVEIHALDGTLTDLPAGVRVALTDPSGTALHYETTAEGGKLVDDKGATGARVYDTPAREFGDGVRPRHPRHICLMVPPTVAQDGPCDPQAGSWTLSLEKPAGAPVSVVLQIQRGDTAPGFPSGGRQSFFEGALVPDPDQKGALTVEAPLTNEGTNSAYSTVQHPRYHAIAASQSRFGDVVPSVYSARGATWSGGGASASMVVDGPFTMGISAAGTASGTQTRLSGTSAAAALFSHGLATQLAVSLQVAAKQAKRS